MTADYRKRYESADNGLRFQELTYTGNFVGLDHETTRQNARAGAGG